MRPAGSCLHEADREEMTGSSDKSYCSLNVHGSPIPHTSPRCLHLPWGLRGLPMTWPVPPLALYTPQIPSYSCPLPPPAKSTVKLTSSHHSPQNPSYIKPQDMKPTFWNVYGGGCGFTSQPHTPVKVGSSCSHQLCYQPLKGSPLSPVLLVSNCPPTYWNNTAHSGLHPNLTPGPRAHSPRQGLFLYGCGGSWPVRPQEQQLPRVWVLMNG